MAKNIVICCDGTGNDVASDSTNVLRLFRSLQRGEEQLAFYDSGVGTLADPTRLTGFGRRVSKKIDGAIGQSVRENVCEAYQFLVRHYRPGDRIFLFGFSRGAYTIRALAGMVHFLGLLRPELEGLARMAWTIYADDNQDLPTGRRFASAGRFKKSFSIDHGVRIHFIGAWDTVSTFGWLFNLRSVPYTAKNPSVDHIRHAVSIDEHRSCFQANLYPSEAEELHQSFKQQWFAGVHADVGGGYPEEESGLAKVALAWMFKEAAQHGCQFVDEQVDEFLGNSEKRKKNVQADALAPSHQSTTGFWHTLEFLPRKQWDSNAQPQRLRWFLPNLYRRRRIPEGAVLHESVQMRLTEDNSYHPSNLPQCYAFGN